MADIDYNSDATALTAANLEADDMTFQGSDALENPKITDYSEIKDAIFNGRAGGQVLVGGNAANEDLALMSTSHATKGEIQAGDVSGGNYSYFESDGTIVMAGNATVFEDANVGGVTLSGPAASQPDIVEVLDSTGSGTDIFTLGFGTGEKVSGAIEIPHSYKEDSDISFHVHWSGNAAPSGTDKVKWQLTFTVIPDAGVVPASTVIVIETDYDTQYERLTSNFPTITGTGFNMGDQFAFSLERIAASTAEYGGDALVYTVGFHYEKDTLGSRQMVIK